MQQKYKLTNSVKAAAMSKGRHDYHSMLTHINCTITFYISLLYATKLYSSVYIYISFIKLCKNFTHFINVKDFSSTKYCTFQLNIPLTLKVVKRFRINKNGSRNINIRSYITKSCQYVQFQKEKSQMLKISGTLSLLLIKMLTADKNCIP